MKSTFLNRLNFSFLFVLLLFAIFLSGSSLDAATSEISNMTNESDNLQSSIALEINQSNTNRMIGSEIIFQAEVSINQAYILNIEFETFESNSWKAYAFPREYDYERSTGYPILAWIEERIDEYYFMSMSENVYIQIVTWDEIDENLTVTLEEITNPPHSLYDDAKPADLGYTTGETFYKNQLFFLSFETIHEQGYTFETTNNNCDWFDTEVVNENLVRINPSSYYFIGNGETIHFMVDNSCDFGEFSFFVNTTEIPEPYDIYYFSENFEAGDFFEYSISNTINGEPTTVEDDPDFFDGQTYLLKVVKSSPSINDYQLTGTYFESYIGDELSHSLVDRFLLPTKITTETGIIYNGVNTLDYMLQDIDFNLVLEGENYALSYEILIDLVGILHVEVVFDVNDFFVISLKSSITTDATHLIEYKLLRYRLAGEDFEIDHTNQSEPNSIYLNLTLSSLFLFFSMMTMLSRRRYNEFDKSIR